MVTFGNTVPGIAIWLIAAAAVVVVIYSFRRDVQFGPASAVLLALRIIFMALMVWCLLLPQRRWTLRHQRRPRFLIALDTSESMSLAPSPQAATRWSLATRALSGDWLTTVSEACEVDLYPFAVDEGSRIDARGAAGLHPNGKATRLRSVLRRLAERYRGQNVAGMVLLSDGVDTEESHSAWTGESWPWPIYTLQTEPPGVWDVAPELRVESVNTPRRVTSGWDTELKAVVSARGADGRAVTVQLRKDGGLIEEKPVQVPAEGGSREAIFKLTHGDPGVHTYEVVAPPLAGEIVTNDNAYAVSIRVVDSKNRLIYIEGPPRWESKYFAAALRANTQVTPICFIRGPKGRFLTIGDRGTMTADMTKSELALFKMVVIGNLDGAELGRHRAANLLEFVDTGGSLVLLGGPKGWGDSGFASTDLKRLLPVSSVGPLAQEGTAPTALTGAGRSHPAFAGEHEQWEVTPPVLSVFPNAVPAPGAEVLVSATAGGNRHPVVVTQRYGQGKVVAVLSDSLWHWKLSRISSGANPYQRFWDQLLGWLSPAEEEIASHELELFADREQMFLGEEIQISARLGRADGRAADDIAVSCEVTTPDGRRIPYALGRQQVVTSSGRSFPGFGMKLKADRPGLHAVRAAAEVEGENVKSDPITFFVKPFTPERVPEPAKMDVLEALARNSGGRFFRDVGEMGDALAAIEFSPSEEEEVKYSSLWQRLPVIVCLLALVSIEWAVRKWRNMP